MLEKAIRISADIVCIALLREPVRNFLLMERFEFIFAATETAESPSREISAPIARNVL